MPSALAPWMRGVVLSSSLSILLTGVIAAQIDARPPAANPVVLSTESAQSAAGFFNSVGVNAHLNYFDRAYGDFSLVQRKLQSLGVRHLRDGAHLRSDEYNRAVYDRWMALGKTGIRFDVVLDPRSALGPLSPQKLEYINHLSGGSIESFEGPNEMDISGLKNWADLTRSYQREIFEAVKAMPTGDKFAVVGPSMAAASNGSQVGDLSPYLNYGNLHPYPACKPPSNVFPSQIDLAHELSDGKPIVITESGYHNAIHDHHDQPAISEAAEAKYILRLFLENFSHGIVRTYLYELLDESPEPGFADLQQHWGLLRSDGSEKPAFQSLQNLLSEVRDDADRPRTAQLRYALSAPQGAVHHLLLAKSSGQYLLILWQPVVSYDCDKQMDLKQDVTPVTLTLDKIYKNITVYEPAIQSLPFHVYANRRKVDLEVPDHPLVLQIDSR